MTNMPPNESWLYYELEQIRNPPFGTIFLIVFKGYMAIMLINLIILFSMVLIGFIVSLLVGGALWNWISHIEILPTFLNLLIFHLP